MSQLDDDRDYSFECSRCVCCIKGKCELEEECNKISDKVIIVLLVLGVALLVGLIGLCVYFKRKSDKKKAELGLDDSEPYANEESELDTEERKSRKFKEKIKKKELMKKKIKKGGIGKDEESPIPK